MSRKVWFIVLIDGYPAVLFLQMLNNFFKNLINAQRKSHRATKVKFISKTKRESPGKGANNNISFANIKVAKTSATNGKVVSAM